MGWTTEDWEQHLSRPDITIWFLRDSEVTKGYCEMELRSTPSGTEVNIKYLGLRPNCVGKKLGPHLIHLACLAARELAGHGSVPTVTVTLDTTSRDNRRALDHYRARGFRRYAIQLECWLSDRRVTVVRVESPRRAARPAPHRHTAVTDGRR